MIAHVFTRPSDGAGQQSALQALSAADVQHTPLELSAHSLVWVDVANPVPADLDWIERTFGFHHLALEDVTVQHQRARIDEYDGYSFAVVYAARVRAEAHRITSDELQFFWGHGYLVTIHAEPLPEIDDLAQHAAAGTVSPVSTASGRPVLVPDLVYRLLDAVVDSYFPAVDALAEWAEDLEEDMFAPRRSQGTLQALFALKKDLFHFRRTIAPGRDVMNVLLRRDNALFGDEFFPYFQDVYDHTLRIIDTLDVYRDLLTAALDTHLSILSNEVSQTVRSMTAITAILMVNGLIAGIYGMNFAIMPEIHWTYGYPWALALMAASSLILWAIFRRIRWL